MTKTIRTLLPLLALLSMEQVVCQNKKLEEKIARLEAQKEEVAQQEKKSLKYEVEAINERLENGGLTEEEAQQLKEEAAKARALNIENRLAILDNKIALLERNDGETMELDTLFSGSRLWIGIGADDLEDGSTLFGIRIDDKKERPVKYDRRTYSDFVVAIGLNNAIIENQSIEDSPYKIGGSRFFEMGWQWRTRVFKNSNWLRFHYGVSLQFNGLKPDNNQYFVQNGDQTELQEFDLQLDKSKLRMDNLVFPLFFEFGPSKMYRSEEKIRYSFNRQFRFGIGAYGGFNIGTRQKLKYNFEGEKIKEKLKRDYNTSDLIYGLSAYAGFDNTLLYIKYDLNPIFRNATVEQRNISLGLRFDID